MLKQTEAILRDAVKNENEKFTVRLTVRGGRRIKQGSVKKVKFKLLIANYVLFVQLRKTQTWFLRAEAHLGKPDSHQ